MNKMKKLLVANWKMNLPQLNKWKRFSAPKNVEVVICPPFSYLRETKEVLGRPLKLGAQDVFWEEKGAFTGEVSPSMLKNSGVEYVIIGHSERRRWLGETDEMVNKKVLAALNAGIKVILCVGEPKEVRKRGLGAAKKFVGNQLIKDLRSVKKKDQIIFAYEPIWAVGTGVPDKAEDSAEIAAFIKSKTGGKVVYGGSITSKNARGFFERKEIWGALVGGASLNAKEFNKIISIASRM